MHYSERRSSCHQASCSTAGFLPPATRSAVGCGLSAEKGHLTQLMAPLRGSLHPITVPCVAPHPNLGWFWRAIPPPVLPSGSAEAFLVTTLLPSLSLSARSCFRLFHGVNPKISLVNFLHVNLLLQSLLSLELYLLSTDTIYILFENMYHSNLGRRKSYQVYFLTTVEWDQKWKAEGRPENSQACENWNNMPLHNQWIIDKIKRQIRKYLEKKQKWKHNILKLMGCSTDNPQREVHSEEHPH